MRAFSLSVWLHICIVTLYGKFCNNIRHGGARSDWRSVIWPAFFLFSNISMERGDVIWRAHRENRWLSFWKLNHSICQSISHGQEPCSSNMILLFVYLKKANRNIHVLFTRFLLLCYNYMLIQSHFDSAWICRKHIDTSCSQPWGLFRKSRLCRLEKLQSCLVWACIHKRKGCC